MQALYRFTDNDIEQLKIAKEALQRIDCWAIACDICPLYFKDEHSSGCFTNLLGYIIRKAECERRAENDN